jgi:hypothetical protein
MRRHEPWPRKFKEINLPKPNRRLDFSLDPTFPRCPHRARSCADYRPRAQRDARMNRAGWAASAPARLPSPPGAL